MAPLRTAPIIVYLLLLLHPANKMPITPMLEAANTKNIPICMSRISAPLCQGRQENEMTEARITK